MRLINALETLLHTKSCKEHKEYLLTTKNMEIICINFEDKTLTMKDRWIDKIVEICMLNRGQHDLALYCLTCLTFDCDHITFAFYSCEVGILRALHTCYENAHSILHAPLSIERMRNMIRERTDSTLMKNVLVKNVIPTIAIFVFCLGMLPINYSSVDGNWHSMLTNLLDLVPFIPINRV